MPPPFGSDNDLPSGYDWSQQEFSDVIEFAGASFRSLSTVHRTRSGKVQRTIYESASLPPHRSQFVMQQGGAVASQSGPSSEMESPPSAALKVVAALFVAGFLFVLFLPALVSIADSSSGLDAADAFQQLTGWQLPPDAEIVEHSNTHGGMTNDGDYVLTIRLAPQQLQALLDADSETWHDCPVAPEIVRSAWDLPNHSGTQYYAKKTFDSDKDWHRGHVVITNLETGFVWIYEWKH